MSHSIPRQHRRVLPIAPRADAARPSPTIVVQTTGGDAIYSGVATATGLVFDTHAPSSSIPFSFSIPSPTAVATGSAVARPNASSIAVSPSSSPAPASPKSTSSSESKDSSGGGIDKMALAGIIAAFVVAGLAVLFVIFVLMRRAKRRKEAQEALTRQSFVAGRASNFIMTQRGSLGVTLKDPGSSGSVASGGGSPITRRGSGKRTWSGLPNQDQTANTNSLSPFHQPSVHSVSDYDDAHSTRDPIDFPLPPMLGHIHTDSFPHSLSEDPFRDQADPASSLTYPPSSLHQHKTSASTSSNPANPFSFHLPHRTASPVSSMEALQSQLRTMPQPRTVADRRVDVADPDVSYTVTTHFSASQGASDAASVSIYDDATSYNDDTRTIGPAHSREPERPHLDLTAPTTLTHSYSNPAATLRTNSSPMSASTSMSNPFEYDTLPTPPPAAKGGKLGKSNKKEERSNNIRALDNLIAALDDVDESTGSKGGGPLPSASVWRAALGGVGNDRRSMGHERNGSGIAR